jgi:hypothetical protein
MLMTSLLNNIYVVDVEIYVELHVLLGLSFKFFALIRTSTNSVGCYNKLLSFNRRYSLDQRRSNMLHLATISVQLRKGKI